MVTERHYANLLSRLLLRRGFDLQFAFPILAPGKSGPLLAAIEALLPRRRLREITAPIFVIGLPRTGSTWLQTLLCAHPDLGYFTHLMHNGRAHIRGACALARWLRLDASAERFIGDSVVHGLRSPSEGMAIWGELLGQSADDYSPPPLRLSDYPADLPQRARRIMATAMAEYPGRTRFFCKNPAFIAYAPLLAELFPDARFIHLVRDARPTANSLLKLLSRCDEQLARIKASGRPLAWSVDRFIPYPRLPRLTEYLERFGPEDIRTTARLWRDAVLFMEEHGASLPNLLTVRFESVVAAPQESVERILRFCGLRPFPSGHKEFDELCGRTGKIRHVNHYRDYAVVGGICAREMRLLGYAEDGGLVAPEATRERFGDVV